MPNKCIIARKNKLIIEFFSSENDTLNEEMKSMIDMMEMKLQYSFERDIKKHKMQR